MGRRSRWMGMMVGLGACVGPAPAPPQTGASSSGSAGSSAPVTVAGSGTGGEGPTTTMELVDTEDGATTEPGGPSCAQSNGGCDPNATCVDQDDSILCTCNPGYEGDGQQCSVDATLPTLRIEVLCLDRENGCNTLYCVVSSAESDQAMLTGDPAVIYEVTLRFRGVMEEKAYFGGFDDGLWNEGGWPLDDGWNTYSLDISDPAQSYWLNSGAQETDHCEMVDYQQTVSIRGGSTVSVTMLDPNGCTTKNLDDGGEPIVIPMIPPAPEAFDGQFLQIDVVDIVPVP